MTDERPPATEHTSPWPLVAAIVLSVTTLATAWTGYESARWGSIQSTWTKTATQAQFAATAQQGIANRNLSSDLNVFGTWLEAEVRGDDSLATAVAERFRPELVPAFEAWRALGRDGELAPGSPFDLPEYRLAARVEAERLTAVAEDASLRGTEAGETSDSYVLTAVLYASVLFLAGIATKIAHPRGARFAVILSVVMLVAAVGLTLTLPVDIGGL
ncbi:hypothetical protein [Sanguibacter sp. HDW7]|uniref:hypothetical protein n=1 Tax=Sanguibacter sp. HDW7 TaxID=2714931 RepID=UPI00140CA694|nr:hypothetical protein [Sanguibacter sp. HDW7]QIK82182.1 hypothetical protein G7063_00010 [Sanguibacter sp. HDW7]